MQRELAVWAIIFANTCGTANGDGAGEIVGFVFAGIGGLGILLTLLAHLAQCCANNQTGPETAGQRNQRDVNLQRMMAQQQRQQQQQQNV